MIVCSPAAQLILGDAGYESPTENEWDIIDVVRVKTSSLTEQMKEDILTASRRLIPIVYESAAAAFEMNHLIRAA